MKLKILLISILITTSAFAFDPGTFDIIMQAGEDYQLSINGAANA